MKMKVEHRVPLSDRAVAILREMDALHTDDRVFPISYTNLRRHLRTLRADIDAHGFRSAFRDWAAENRVADDVAEKCLAHDKGSKTVKAYLRNDLLELRRPVMQRWARHCSGETVDNVVSLRA
jgi:integrase